VSNGLSAAFTLPMTVLLPTVLNTCSVWLVNCGGQIDIHGLSGMSIDDISASYARRRPRDDDMVTATPSFLQCLDVIELAGNEPGCAPAEVGNIFVPLGGAGVNPLTEAMTTANWRDWCPG